MDGSHATLTGGTHFADLATLYAMRGGTYSPEWDYGVHWIESQEQPWPRWRVSWVVETGDVYATARGKGVIVLGNVPANGDYPYSAGHEAWDRWRQSQPIEHVLGGWENEPTRLLAWAIGRLELHRQASSQ